MKICAVVGKRLDDFRLLLLLCGDGLFLCVVSVLDVLLDTHGDGLINFLVRRGQRRVLADLRLVLGEQRQTIVPFKK